MSDYKKPNWMSEERWGQLRDRPEVTPVPHGGGSLRIEPGDMESKAFWHNCRRAKRFLASLREKDAQ